MVARPRNQQGGKQVEQAKQTPGSPRLLGSTSLGMAQVSSRQTHCVEWMAAPRLTMTRLINVNATTKAHALAVHFLMCITPSTCRPVW